MTYSVGKSEVANYANTSSGKVTNVVADNGLGGAGVVTEVTDRVALSFVIATNMQYPTINVSAIPGYIAGKSDLVITVNPDVYVYGYSYSVYNSGTSNPFSATMNILGGAAGDTIKLVNNGYILGSGGDGGGAISGQPVSCCCNYSYQWTVAYSTPGQAALAITYPLILENNGYIAGGGGGGASINESDLYSFSVMGGGGGAGGGIGIDRIGTVAVRAVPPNVGNNGEFHLEYYGGCGFCGPSRFYSGGSGGFVLPGVGGLASTGTSSVGAGGGSGGAGSAYDRLGISHVYNNNGGTANGAAPVNTTYPNAIQSGGGGGWGARGGDSYKATNIITVGKPGGNSIITNGNAITTITAGTQYGAIRTSGTTYVETISASSTSPTFITIPLGYTNAIIIVPTGVILASDSIFNPALYVSAELNFAGNSEVQRLKIIVNGAILGRGGSGGSEASTPEYGGTAIKLDAFSVIESVTLDCTYGYVAGGGGGGGFVQWAPSTVFNIYGGGGAGGGDSGATGVNPAYGATTVNTSGDNGTTIIQCGSEEFISGGGGGLIVPGTTVSLGTKNTAAAFPGIGGSGGGSGAARKISATSTTFVNNGGGFNQIGGTQSSTLNQASGGGGGGWGSSGGGSRRQALVVQSGEVPGAAIDTQINLPVYVINPANLAGQIF